MGTNILMNTFFDGYPWHEPGSKTLPNLTLSIDCYDEGLKTQSTEKFWMDTKQFPSNLCSGSLFCFVCFFVGGGVNCLVVFPTRILSTKKMNLYFSYKSRNDLKSFSVVQFQVVQRPSRCSCPCSFLDLPRNTYSICTVWQILAKCTYLKRDFSVKSRKSGDLCFFIWLRE